MFGRCALRLRQCIYFARQRGVLSRRSAAGSGPLVARYRQVHAPCQVEAGNGHERRSAKHAHRCGVLRYKGARRTLEGAESHGSSITCIVLTMQSPSATVRSGLICRKRAFRPKARHGGKGMFHLLWYLIIGLLAGLISKSVMHVHLTLMWTIVLGVIGSLLGGGVTHMVFRPKTERYHTAGFFFSTLGAFLFLFICYKLNFLLPPLCPRIWM